jgi:hypothetical protein
MHEFKMIHFFLFHFFYNIFWYIFIFCTFFDLYHTRTHIMTDFEKASVYLDELSQALPDSITDDHLQILSVEAFTELCEVVRKRVHWDKAISILSTLKGRYLESCTDPAKLIETILTSDTTYRSLDPYRSQVLQFLKTHECTSDMIQKIWRGKMEWTIEEARQLPVAFFAPEPAPLHRASSMIVSHAPRHKRFKSQDEDDYESDHKNIQCSCQELLVVACLMYREDLNVDELLKQNTAWCSPSLHHLPLKVKKFTVTPDSLSPDLLATVHTYYTDQAIISPAIQYRRNVALLVGNTLGRIKPFSSRLNEHSSSITFEVPYMCYMIPNSVKVEFSAFQTEALTEEMVHVTCGTDYLLMNPATEEAEAKTFEGQGLFIHKQVDCERPCVYLSLSMTSLRSAWWQSVKVHGEAICFV